MQISSIVNLIFLLQGRSPKVGTGVSAEIIHIQLTIERKTQIICNTFAISPLSRCSP